MKREQIIAEIKLKWQKHNRDNGLSWNEVAELVNEVVGIDHQPMSAEEDGDSICPDCGEVKKVMKIGVCRCYTTG